jgi:DNA-binding Lrp family transcriptional regulator
MNKKILLPVDREIVSYIKDYTKAMKCSPSLVEIADEIGFARESVRLHVKKLVKSKVLKYDKKLRGRNILIVK